MPGVYVQSRIQSDLSEKFLGKYDDLPEAAFLSVGTIEDVVKSGDTLMNTFM